uniref:4Fe-4S dicluster domain-containing protein n=1 Tax=Desulfococcus sp. TaxID=2025834 RepID=UPI0035938996
CGLHAPAATCVRPADREFRDIPTDIPVHCRVPMPEAQPAVRTCSFSEVAMGLSEAQVREEAGRCLQCGACSECMQCVEACGAMGAIRHAETEEAVVEHAGAVIIADPDMAPAVKGDDIIRAYGPKSAKPDVYALMMRGYAAASQAILLMGDVSGGRKGNRFSFTQPDPGLSPEIRIGVFVCRCNDSLGWVAGMDRYVEDLAGAPDVVHAGTLPSACVPEGIAGIIKTVRDKGITRLVLGSCVCCPLNFVCSACTDQRSRLKHALFTATGISRSMVMVRNIRGEALSLLKKNPDQALTRLRGLIDRSVKRSRKLTAFPSPTRLYNFATAVIGQSEAAVTSALTLADMGMDVFMFEADDAPAADPPEHPNIHAFTGARISRLSGNLGDFQLTVETEGGHVQQVQVGAVILGEKARKRVRYVHQEGLPSRAMAVAMQTAGVPGVPFFYPGMTSVSGLFLADPPGIRISARQKGAAAAMLTAAAMPTGARQNKGFTVTVDEAACRGCGRCIDACSYQAVTMKPDGTGWHAVVDEAFCKGCGNCISVCPTNAADSPFRSQKFFEETLEEILLH